MVIVGGRECNPLQCLPGNSQADRLVGYSLWGAEGLDVTEQLAHTLYKHTHLGYSVWVLISCLSTLVSRGISLWREQVDATMEKGASITDIGFHLTFVRSQLSH